MSDFLNNMYGQVEEEESENEVIEDFGPISTRDGGTENSILATTAVSHIIMIDGKRVEIPSMAHVRKLDSRLAQSERKVADLKRKLNISNTRHLEITKELNRVNKELDRKVNIRD